MFSVCTSDLQQSLQLSELISVSDDTYGSDPHLIQVQCLSSFALSVFRYFVTCRRNGQRPLPRRQMPTHSKDDVAEEIDLSQFTIKVPCGTVFDYSLLSVPLQCTCMSHS